MAYFSLINGYDPAVINALVECESSWDVNAVNKNKNGSIDYSLFQINNLYHKQAVKMGLDIKDPGDNIIYAFQLIQKEGLAPWKASANCIKKKTGNSLSEYWDWRGTS